MNTKGIKFLAVLAVLAMAFAAVAVITDAQQNEADSTVAHSTDWSLAEQGPLDFAASIDEDGFGKFANVDLMNNIYVSYDAAAKKYTVYGTLAYQTIEGAKDTPFEKLWEDNTDHHYGLAFLVKDDSTSKAEFKIKVGTGREQTIPVNDWSSSLLFIKDKTKTSSTVVITGGNFPGTYTIDYSNVTLSANAGSNPTFAHTALPNGNALAGLDAGTWNGATGVGEKGTWAASKVLDDYFLTFTGYEGSEYFEMPINAVLTVKVSGSNKITTDANWSISSYGNVSGTNKTLKVEPVANGDSLTVDNAGTYGIVGQPLRIGGDDEAKKLNITVTAGAQGVYSAYSSTVDSQGLIIKNATATIGGGERGINAGNDSKLKIVTSTVEAKMTGSGKTNQDGDNDNWGVKTKVLDVAADSTLKTQGLRIISGGSIAETGIIQISGDYVPSDKVSPAIAGLYYEGSAIITAYEYTPTADSYILLKDNAVAFGLVTVKKSTTPGDDDKKVVPADSVTSDDSIKDAIKTNGETDTAVAINAGGATKIKDVTVEKGNVEFIGTGNPTITGMDVTILNTSGESKEVTFSGFTSISGTITTTDGSKSQTMTLKEVKGNFSIRQGSIYIDGKLQGGTIELDKGVEVKMTGTVDTDNVTIKMKTAGDTAKVIIEEDQTIVIDNHALIIEAGITLEVYGKITNKEGKAASLTVNQTSTSKGKVTVMPGGSIAAADTGSITVNGSGTSNLAYSGSDINTATITPANWSGKDAAGGTWTFTGGVLTLNNYNGTFNFESFNDTVTSIEITGDNKISYALPEGDAATEIFGNGNNVTKIFTIDTASLAIEVDYSKLTKTGINAANVIFSVADDFMIQGVDVTIVAKGSNNEWVDFGEGNGIRVTAIDGEGSMSIKNAELDIDVLSALDSKYVYAIDSRGAVGEISIKNSEVDINSAGTGIRSNGTVVPAVSSDDIEVSASVFSINAKHAAIFADNAKVAFDTCVEVNITGELGIIAEDIEFDSCADVVISATEYAIVGFDIGGPFDLSNDIMLSHSIVSVKGDVYTDGKVDMTKSIFTVDGMLWITNFTLIQDSVLTVKDLYIDGLYNETPALDKTSKITKGIVNVMGSATIVGDLTNDDTINNAGVFGVYNKFTNNGTFNNSGKFFVYAKEEALSDTHNDTITVVDDLASEGKVKVKKIDIVTAIMNADGTVAITAMVTFAKDAGEIVPAELKVGTNIFEGTLSVADLVDTDDHYYILDLTNGTATIKVTYKKLTEGADTKIGKSYTIDVAGKITTDAPAVDYDLQVNADGKTVTDTTVTYETKLIGASGADFKSTGANSAVVSEGKATIFNSVTKTIGGAFAGDLYTYLDSLTVGTFKGDIYSKGTVTLTPKKIMVGDIYTEGVVTINGTLVGNIDTEDSVVISGTVEGNVTVTAGTTAKTVTVGGKFAGDLIFNSEYLAKSTDKPGEESVTTNVMKVDADMSTSEKTFVINLTASKNATTSTAGEGGAFAFGALNAPVATKAVQLKLTTGKIVVPSDVTLPERFEVIIEKDTTLEVAKNYKFNVKSAALKVSKDAIRNFVISTDVSATYGTVEYIMTFDIEGGAYTIFSDVTYALTSCDEGAELTLGSAAEINANVSVKKGVSIIVDGVKLDFKTFGLDMDEGAKIILKGAGNLAFAATGDNTGDADRKENEYYTISGTIVYDGNALTFDDVRFNAPSIIKGTAATSTEVSKINATLLYNEGTATVSAGTGTGTITLANTSYFLEKDDTEKTLFSATFVVGPETVFDAVAINDAFAVVDYKKDAGDTEAKIDKYKAYATIVGVGGVLNLSNTTYVKGAYGGTGTIFLADGKEFILAKSDAVPGAAAEDKTIPGIVAAKIVDTTDNQNGYVLNFVSAEPDKTLTFKATKQKIASENYNVMTVAGEVGTGIITATDDAVLNGLKINEGTSLVGNDVYIVGASVAEGHLAAKEIYMYTEDTKEFAVLTYEVTYVADEYTIYTYFKSIDFDYVTDLTITKDLAISQMIDDDAKKLDLSGKDVNITIAEGKKLVLDKPLIIGTPIDSIGDEGSSIVGKVVIGVYVTNDSYTNAYLIAYADVDLTEAEIYGYDGKTEAVYSILDIEDIPYAIIFANENGEVAIDAGAHKAQTGQVLATVDKSIVPEIEGYVFTKWYNYDETDASFVGQTNAYAGAKAITVFVTVKFAEGVSYYCDGVEFAIYDTPVKVEYNSVFTAKINNTAKYEGTPLINGKNSFIVTEDATLTVTGVNPIPVPPEPTPEPEVGDSGLSLTDILLIVLVILIAIMVVILVLRLNRS